ncbi:MAG TPA: hypothetical protein GXZ58_10590 [Bacilli bacterium]|nr:hypothetical protein [Bacilli bacterium]
MKKIIFLLLMGLTIIMFFIFIQKINVEKTEEIPDVKVEEAEFEMSGYYYFGYLDQREKQDHTIEKDYFDMMDNHFQEYQNSTSIILNENKEVNEDIIDYFESIGGLRLYSMPATDTTLQNGDYLTLLVKGPIQESYPAVITKLEKTEILYPRN